MMYSKSRLMELVEEVSKKQVSLLYAYDLLDHCVHMLKLADSIETAQLDVDAVIDSKYLLDHNRDFDSIEESLMEASRNIRGHARWYKRLREMILCNYGHIASQGHVERLIEDEEGEDARVSVYETVYELAGERLLTQS